MVKEKLNWKMYFSKNELKNLLIITAAAVLYSAGIGLFIDPNNLVPGGATGIAIMVNRLTNVETGTIVFLINIPLMLIGVWKLGIQFLIKTIYAIMLTSVFINIFATFPQATNDILLAALAGGIMISASVGIIFKAGATTGGTDILVQLIKLKYKHLKSGKIFMITDMTIIALSIFIFRNIDSALYSAITVVTSSIILDMVLYGKDEAKLLYIILKSEEYEQILATRLLDELEVGVTYLKGYGAYQNHEKKVLLCAIRKQQLPKAKEIVKEVDESSFMIITSANEIIGEGYKSHNSRNL